jgi:hypothetical protein
MHNQLLARVPCLDFSLPKSHRTHVRLAPAILLLSMCAGTSFGQPSSSSTNAAAAASRYGNLPLSFETNSGQTDSEVRFLSHGRGYSLFLTDSAAVLSLSKEDEVSGAIKHQASSSGKVKTDVVRMELEGASHDVRASGDEPLPGKVNYFIGNDPAKWQSGIATYGRVKYAGVYPGVDLIYYGNQRQLEYDFVVAPKADTRPIRLHFDGAAKLSLNGDGDLTVSGQNGEVAFHKPVAYQLKEGKRMPVDSKFELLANNDLGFVISSYDHSRELVIDPTLAYSTYLGGSAGGESVNGIAADRSGYTYVIGTTPSTNFPTTAGSTEPSRPATVNPNVSTAFVTKFSQDGTSLVYSTFLGGNSGEYGSAIALDTHGHAFVTGTTFSSDFPVTPGAYQKTLKPGTGAIFVTELSQADSYLVYSTYVNGVEQASGIAVDSTDHAYVTGFTNATTLPVSANAYQLTNRAAPKGLPNGYVIKLSQAGNTIDYATYLGGTRGDWTYAIAVDSSEHAYVTGLALSVNFPVTSSAYQKTNKCGSQNGSNAFITKFNADGSGLDYSTYLGGTGNPGPSSNNNTVGDWGNGIAVDLQGNAYVTGTAYSLDFPHTNGAFQITNNGYITESSNAFVTKLNGAGTQVIYSTYLGGSGVWNAAPLDDNAPVSFGDIGTAIAVDSKGDAYVTGTAVSGNFPTTSDANQPQDPSQDYNEDGNNQVGYFTKLNPAGSALLYSTYLGGSGCGGGIGATFDGQGDVSNTIAVDVSGNAYLGGSTCSVDFPATAGAFQPSNNSASIFGQTTGFVSKFWPLTITPAPSVTQSPTTLQFPNTLVGAYSSIFVTLNNLGSGTFEVSNFVLGGASASQFSGQALTCNTIIEAGSSCTFSVSFSPTWAGSYGGYISFDVSDNYGATQTTFTYDLSGTGFFAGRHPR